MVEFAMNPVESRLGIAVEATEGTAETEPDIELFLIDTGTFDLTLVEDNKINFRAFNEPYKRQQLRGYTHAEATTNGLKFSPTNGVPELLGVGFGGWYTSTVYTLEVEADHGTSFDRGDVIFGATSLARAEVAKVDDDVLYLIGVKGTFSNGEEILAYPGETDKTYDAKTHDTSAFNLVTDDDDTLYYCHKLEAVRSFSSKGVVKVCTTTNRAAIMDPMIDFSQYGRSTGKRYMQITVQDTATSPVHIMGYMGEPLLAVPYDGGTGPFAVGKTVTIDNTVAGTVYADYVITANTVGVLFIDQAGTAETVTDGLTITDDGTGSATSNCSTIPCYTNNACKIWNGPGDVVDYTNNWNGDATTFDETDVLTYTAVQRAFDQKSLTLFMKSAGDNTQVAYGMKVREIAFDITAERFTYDVSYLGQNMKYLDIEPAYPGGFTDSSPFGAAGRTFELDGSSAGAAAHVNRARFSATWTFSPGRGVVITENFPTALEPTDYGIIGTMDVQFKDNQMMLDWWNNPGGKTVAFGTKLSKRLFFSLDSGDEVGDTGEYKKLDIGVMGTIDTLTLNRDREGYIQPITIEGIMSPQGAYSAPCVFYMWDGASSH